MDEKQLQPVAAMLSDAYFATWVHSRTFFDEYGYPPTRAEQVQYLRSVVQASLQKSDRYQLGADYMEFGRVLFTDLETDRTYLLRSRSAVSIEQEKNQRSLFDSLTYFASDVVMIVYRFFKEKVDLSIAGTRHQVSRTHLEASGAPTFIGSWPFVEGEHPAFDQRSDDDPFSTLGELDIDEEEGDEK